MISINFQPATGTIEITYDIMVRLRALHETQRRFRNYLLGEVAATALLRGIEALEKDTPDAPDP